MTYATARSAACWCDREQMEDDGDSMPTWVRWVIIGAGAMLVGLIAVGVAVFLWPWVSVFR